MKSARMMLRTHAQGVLATLGRDPVADYPFASVTPFCLDGAGRPVVLISRLAQHTKHVEADGRVALFIQGPTHDPQAEPRLTLTGDLLRIPDDEAAGVAERYYRYFPATRDFHRQLDFRFWRLEPYNTCFVAGFARVHWLDAPAILESSPFDTETEAGMLDHMNQDHADALPDYLRYIGETPGSDPVMVGLDGLAFHIRHGDRISCIPFGEPVANPGQVRSRLVQILQAARTGEAAS